MKNLAIIILCFFSIFSQGQTNEFAPVGAKWYFEQSTMSPQISYVLKESIGDTLINNKICRIIKGGISLCGYDNEFEYLYSDSNVVYRYYKDINQFYILYDFNAKKGNFWLSPGSTSTEIWKYLVDSISSIVVDNKSLKVIYVSAYDSSNIVSFSKRIIEKIGSDFYMFPQSESCDPITGGLRCYFDDSIYFNNNNIHPSCDYISLGKEHIIMNNSIEIHPNPFQKSIFVNIYDVQVSKIEIYNLIGFPVFEKNTLRYKNEIELDLSSLISGVYIAKITTSDNKIVLKKILKM